MPVSAGTIFGRYEIRSPLGAGGMGEVYLAFDEQLKRMVALKILPAELSAKPDRLARFQQEAYATSALNHPNIVTIYGIGAAHGTNYIATEYVEGETLRQRLNRLPRPLPFNEALDIATQIAQALAAAHEARVVHRDVKPENIMRRRDGYVKVLDFGLAKLNEKDTGQLKPGLTNPGMVVGTVAYMSPEQARGLAVDERSDIFSYGVVLYEMLSHRLPFSGLTSNDTMAQILYRDPPPLSQTSVGVPPLLERIVHRALAKDCAARYPNMRALLDDLLPLKQQVEYETQRGNSRSQQETVLTEAAVGDQFTGSGSTAPTVLTGYVANQSAWTTMSGPRIDSLAVLPLANANPDASLEYLSDGITESLINTLSQLPQIKVLARATVFRYKGQAVTPEQMRQELGVRAVLLGRVLQFGANLVVKAELVDTFDGSHLWGEEYRRAADDIFAVQDEISQEISAKLRLKLSGEERQRLVKRYTENAEAYRLYLLGRFCLAKQTRDGFDQALRHFDQAIALDPAYALAYAGLADTYYGLSSLHLPPDEAMPQARAAAVKALELDDALAEAHAALGLIKFYYEWDWQGAESCFKRASELHPGYAEAHHRYGWLLCFSGRLTESIAAIQRASELDPLSLEITSDLGLSFFCARDYRAALPHFQKALEGDPASVWSHFFVGWAHEQMGNFEEAFAAYDRARKIDDAPLLRAAVAHLFATDGGTQQARALFAEMLDLAQIRHISPYHFAIVHTALGETDEAFARLEEAYLTRSEALAWLKVDPRLDPLRSDPRFIGLLQRVGLPL
jgi:serine/threonine-protein kinase